MLVIFITAGLLKRLRTEDQLAGVLGHEIGHVIGRHSAEQMAKQQLSQGLVNAAVVAAQDPNNPNSSGALAQYVANIISMKFGREDELEADRFGIKYMAQTRYKPQAMIEVLEILRDAMQGQRQPEMMSTHPYPENRIAQIEEILAKQQTIGDDR